MADKDSVIAARKRMNLRINELFRKIMALLY